MIIANPQHYRHHTMYHYSIHISSPHPIPLLFYVYLKRKRNPDKFSLIILFHLLILFNELFFLSTEVMHKESLFPFFVFRGHHWFRYMHINGYLHGSVHLVDFISFAMKKVPKSNTFTRKDKAKNSPSHFPSD